MIMCRQVAKALANNRYYELPWYRRIPMFIHIRLCIMCGKYHQQIIDLQRGVRDYLEQEEKGELDPNLHLSEASRRGIAEQLRKNK